MGTLPPLMRERLGLIVQGATPGTTLEIAEAAMLAGWVQGLEQALEGTRGDGCECEDVNAHVIGGICGVCYLVDTQRIAYGLKPSDTYEAARKAAAAAAEQGQT